MASVAQAIIQYLPLLQVIEQVVPGLAKEVIALFSSTAGNPTAADWQALATKVAATPFDAPPSA